MAVSGFPQCGAAQPVSSAAVAAPTAPHAGRADLVISRLEQLAEIDRDAGANRHGLSPAEQRAHDLVAGWMRDAGLAVEVDGAGNLRGRAPGADPGLADVWSGSHLDTPPDGGAFDGALGVLAAVEAAGAIHATGGLRRGVTAVAFRLEEGPRFGRGVFGSRALVGRLEPDEGDLVDADGITLAQAFAGLGLGDLPGRALAGRPPHVFVEAHIEQGPVLADRRCPLGVVTSIAGMAGFEIVFHGRRGHAGTVPMHLRADALAAAARFVTELHAAAGGIPGAVATVGRLHAEPGATNTIPERATLFADVRAPDEDGLRRLVGSVESAAAGAARAARCEVAVAERWSYPPQPMDGAVMNAVRQGIGAAGHQAVELPSGAGHDAGILAAAGIPSGMLFVRSDAGGVSHSPDEHTGADAVAACLAALEHTLRVLAG
jgi:hydantoinase/carbamoylase family amidase